MPPGALLPSLPEAGDMMEMSEKADPRSLIHNSRSLLQCPHKGKEIQEFYLYLELVMWRKYT